MQVHKVVTTQFEAAQTPLCWTETHEEVHVSHEDGWNILLAHRAEFIFATYITATY